MNFKVVITILALTASTAATVYLYRLGAPYSSDDFFGIGKRGPIYFDRPVNLRPSPPPGGGPSSVPTPTGIAATPTPPAGPAVVVSIALEPASINSGERTRLTWSAENVVECLASGVWSGQIAVADGRAGGSIPLSPSRVGEHAYSLTCKGISGESVSRTANVTVSGGGSSVPVAPPPPSATPPPPPPPPPAGGFTPTPSPTATPLPPPPSTWPGSVPPPAPTAAPPPAQFAGSANLTIYPPAVSQKVGDTFLLTLAVDTFGSPVVAVKALLEFDPAHLEVVSVDSAESVFPIEAERLIHPGDVTVTRGRLSPGFTGSNGTVAVIQFRALAAGVGNIRVLLNDEQGSGPSSVILDDGWGTDILTFVTGADYTISQ